VDISLIGFALFLNMGTVIRSVDTDSGSWIVEVDYHILAPQEGTVYLFEAISKCVALLCNRQSIGHVEYGKNLPNEHR